MERFFDKELDLDTVVNRMKPDTVRERLNFRIVSNSDGSHGIEGVLGTKLFFSLERFYQPIGWRGFPNKFVVFSTPNDAPNTNNNGEIGIVTVDETAMIATYTPLYNHQGLQFDINFNIEADNYEENTVIGRTYWTDRNRALRALNVNARVYQTYFNPIDVANQAKKKKYMVLRGVVQDGTGSLTTYGPLEAAGTVFTTAAFGPAYIIVGGPSLVIEYVPVETIDVSSSKILADIHLDRWISGRKEVGQYIYVAQLLTADGGESPFSYFSPPIHLTGGSTGGVVEYQNYQGQSSVVSSAPNLTAKGIRVKISDIDQNYQKIRVGYILVSCDNQIASPVALGNVIIFTEQNITATEMTFDDIEMTGLFELLISDVNAIRVNLRTVGTLAIIQNYLAVGKIRSNVDYNFDCKTGTVVKNIDYLFPADIKGHEIDANVISGVERAEVNITSGRLRWNVWHHVTGGTINYNGTAYGPGAAGGEHFQCLVANGNTYSIISGSPQVQAEIRIQKYTGTYKYIPITEDWYDMKGIAVMSELGSAWRDETSRLGLMLYDNIGNPLFVLHLFDKKVPEQWRDASYIDPDNTLALGFDARLCEEEPGYQYSLRSIGFNVSNLDLNRLVTVCGAASIADLKNFFSGFSIVRCATDRETICQGMLHPMAEAFTHPGGMTVLSQISTVNYAYDGSFVTDTAAHGRTNKYYFFISPDNNFRFENLPNREAGDFLKIADYLYDRWLDQSNPFASVPYSTGEREGTSLDAFFEKNINSVAPSANAARKGDTNEIMMAANFGFDAAIPQSVLPDFPGGISSAYFTSLMWINSLSSAAIDGGAANPRRMIACDGVVVGLKASEGGAYVSGSSYPLGFGDFPMGAFPILPLPRNRPLVNWKRKKTNLYGGNDAAALANNEYILSGHIQAFDDNFIAYLQGNGGIVNDIEVFGGDAFVSIMDNTRAVNDDGSGGSFKLFSLTTFFPVESAVNPELREGRHASRNHTLVANATSANNPVSQIAVEEYLYNKAFSYKNGAGVYPAIPLDFNIEEEENHIVRISLQKTDGEKIDNMRKFLVNNFKMLNGWSGDVVNLRAKNNKLFYWQNDSFGYLPINERTTIATTLGDPVTLGTGGVMARFDELHNYWGNQHQFGLCETENGFHWIDMRRRAWCIASTGGEVIELSTVKGLQSFLRSIRGPILTNDKPAAGIGIHLAYDNAFKEVLASFKGMTDGQGNLLADITHSYDNKEQQYAGTYSFNPGLMLNFANRIISFNRGSKLAQIQPLTVYALKDFVLDGSGIYTCILPFTTRSIPTLPLSDTTHWVVVGKINGIQVHNEGELSKFYGVVYPTRVKFPINSDPSIAKVFDNAEMTGNDIIFDNATYETINQIAQDIGTSANPEYEYRNKSWLMTLPVTANGDRLIDRWMMVTWEKENYLNGSIIQSDGRILKIVSAIFDYRKAF